jgi:CRISPR-associated endonuclease Csn1
MSKKILGLDLGVSSIGWALVTDNSGKKEISGMGSRIIPMSTDDKDEFSSGNKISKNQKRTTRRTQRKGYDRYQLRRQALTKILIKHDLFPGEELLKLPVLELWGLRANAVSKKVQLKEFGRILYHLNQKRGYKSSRSDSNLDKKDTEYVAEVKNRHQLLKQRGITIGQKLFDDLRLDQHYKIKQQVFPREAYIEEFHEICKQQQKHYPEVITEDFISFLRDYIIYYQRNLKSQKGLVKVCEFEGFRKKSNSGREAFVGPKVAPKSSPLFQVCKIWESINTIRLRNKKGEELVIPLEKKQELFNYLDRHERLTSAKLFEILGLGKADGWYSNKQIERGIQGNTTKSLLLKHLDQGSEHLRFDLEVMIDATKDVFLVDKNSGEITATSKLRIVRSDVENELLYKLWHTIYSISDVKECTNALVNKFKLERSVAVKLAEIDFSRFGFGNKSARSIRKILPYLMEGYVYSDACSFAGYNHSNSLTHAENDQRKLIDTLPNLPKNSLRQPVVEKILNQMINLVNAIIQKHGKPNEIRVELARELKQNKEERNETFTFLSKRERENESIRNRIIGEYGLRATRNNVIKWRLFHEITNNESKTNASCIYCGKMFGITDAIIGAAIDVEHIIPKSLLFDDSQSNKTLSHRQCNQEKDNKTAYDYMNGKSTSEFNQYLDRVDSLYRSKLIGKAKRDKLLMSEAKIPRDFIERHLRETQYISRKSKEILSQASRNVWSTSGSVTEYLRRTWGWDDVLMNLQLPKYRQLGMTDWKEWETLDGQKHKKEIIKGWSKRDDHRHHAVDALVIACTEQGFIQRINTLASKGNREEMYKEVGSTRNKGSLLDSYILIHKPFTTKEVEIKTSEILVSFKAGKKVATTGNRKVKKDGKKIIVQKNLLVPRGSLSEESVYGRIRTLEKKPVKFIFENPDLIFKAYIKNLVNERLTQNSNDVKKSLNSLKKDPIYLDVEKSKILEFASCYKNEYVMKYPLVGLKAKDAEHIVDLGIRSLVKARISQFINKEKEAFKEPLYSDAEKKMQIKTVRMFTGLSSVEPVKKDTHGREIGFVKPGNNHHIAFYLNEHGKKVEHSCTFWHAVERKRLGMPVVIKNPSEAWDKVLSNKTEYPVNFIEKLPSDKWSFSDSLQQNEYFLLGLKNTEITKLLETKNYKELSDYIYLTWSISESDYWFRHHLETKNTELKNAKGAKESRRFYRFKSIAAFESASPYKIRINSIGDLVATF